MTNLALGKTIEEKIIRPGTVTDGTITGYTGSTGHARFAWPGTLTLDLGSIEKLKCIRLLLWDNLGKLGNQRDDRIYKYRLLTSVDHQIWKVLYDTGDDGFNGWQVFHFPNDIQAQYIRVHGLSNSKNPEFHIVQLEAYDTEPLDFEADIVVNKEIDDFSCISEEIGDGLPIEQSVQSMIIRLEQLVDEDPGIINPEPINAVISNLRTQVRDIGKIEKSMASIRREIINPVRAELEVSNRLGKFSKWGFVIGIIGGTFAIISLLIDVMGLDNILDLISAIGNYFRKGT